MGQRVSADFLFSFEINIRQKIFMISKIFKIKPRGFWDSISTYWTMMTMMPLGLSLSFFLSVAHDSTERWLGVAWLFGLVDAARLAGPGGEARRYRQAAPGRCDVTPNQASQR